MSSNSWELAEHEKYLKGQGAQKQIHNRFERQSYVTEHWEGIDEVDEGPEKTSFIEVHPKTIITPNSSPDVPFDLSINPYQGCEHGCVYCYARNSHQYWGYGPGRDFERAILVKKNAATLLEKTFRKKSYRPELIVISGNTDCYQPIERKLGLTRQLLQVFQRYQHPVGLITKNSMIQRDIDILAAMAEKDLVRVTISITSLKEETRRKLEPRTASVSQRLKTVRRLSDAGIPVNVNLAPIIPAINSDEVFDIVQAAADHGAVSANYIMVRLNGAIGEIFSDWVHKAYPERAEKVLHLIREVHEGGLNSSEWKTRMRGTGTYADQIHRIFDIARQKFLPKKEPTEMDYSRFSVPDRGQQTSLFS
ncbi:MAG: PA0069 family radical SAM protein [Flavobacteriales bacterium]|nr:PA0069 family radical SAM protein [Flavobacteriales bacterium]